MKPFCFIIPPKVSFFPCILARFMRTAAVLAGWTTIQPSTPPRPLVANITDLGRGAGVVTAGVGVGVLIVLVSTVAAAMVV